MEIPGTGTVSTEADFRRHVCARQRNSTAVAACAHLVDFLHGVVGDKRVMLIDDLCFDHLLQNIFQCDDASHLNLQRSKSVAAFLRTKWLVSCKPHPALEERESASLAPAHDKGTWQWQVTLSEAHLPYG